MAEETFADEMRNNEIRTAAALAAARNAPPRDNRKTLPDARKLVLVSNAATAENVQRAFGPEWHVVAYGAQIHMSRQYELIAMVPPTITHNEQARRHSRYVEHLKHCLRPGGQFVEIL